MQSLSAPTDRSVKCWTVLLSAALVIWATLIPTSAAEPSKRVLLLVGDSISAAYGLPAGSGWSDLLAARLAKQGFAYQVVNASISGDTTAGGRARLPALMARYKPAIVVIELGGNDGLRGGNLSATRENLTAMVSEVERGGAKAVLIGMRLPPNYGPSYVREFDANYARVAAENKAALVPFFFEGFADRNDLFQADRIHPTVEAQPMLLDNVWPVLMPLLGKPR
jgi:acyl-CoA thioesterase-1